MKPKKYRFFAKKQQKRNGKAAAAETSFQKGRKGNSGLDLVRLFVLTCAQDGRLGDSPPKKPFVEERKMKKAIALTLALAMASSMSAIALAGDEPIAPNTYAPGSVISIEAGAFADANGAAPTAELNRNNFTVSADWDKGTTMVDTVRIDNDDNEVQITLKESYTITEARALEGTISLKAKSEDKTVYTMDLKTTA